MADLVRPQIHEACKLALPEGLKELMSDISREVLRAQPMDLYQFIADYLSAMMVVRTNLTVASQLCDDVCTSHCNQELEDELRYLGLDDEDAEKVRDIVYKHFGNEEVKEQSIMIKIARNTSIDSSLLPEIQKAIQRAFRRHMVNNTVIYESSSDSDLDDVARAAKHTLKLYRKTRHTEEEYTQAAVTIQTAYRAYGVRRSGPPQEPENKPPEKFIRFGHNVQCVNSSEHSDEGGPSRTYLQTASSTSLAGSYLNLPRYVPYSCHDHEVLHEMSHDEDQEKESHSILYNGAECSSSGHRRISFQETQEVIEDNADLADDESERSVEEAVHEENKGNDDDF